jgi:two-component sensor histidine kinase
LRPGVDVTEAKATLMGRFEALAQVMGILTDGEWKGAGLKEILEAEMRPFAGRYQATGPSLMLTPRAAQTMTLAIHELVTNSAKHGALSRDEGSVSVTVGVEDSADGPIVRFEWLEQGGPPVQPPTRRGFGVQLLERIAPGDLSGQSELVYHPDGFSYRLTAPLIELEQRQP